MSRLYEIFCTSCLWPWPDLCPLMTMWYVNAIHYVLSVLWTTSCLHIVGQNQSDDVVWSRRSCCMGVLVTGVKSAVLNCLVFVYIR